MAWCLVKAQRRISHGQERCDLCSFPRTHLSRAIKQRKLESITLREEHRLRVSESRVLRRVFGPERGEWREGGEDCIMRSVITFTLHQMLLVLSHTER